MHPTLKVGVAPATSGGPWPRDDDTLTVSPLQARRHDRCLRMCSSATHLPYPVRGQRGTGPSVVGIRPSEANLVKFVLDPCGIQVDGVGDFANRGVRYRHVGVLVVVLGRGLATVSFKF